MMEMKTWKRNPLWQMLLSLIMSISLVSVSFADIASAASSESKRIAQVQSLKGEVFVKKSGGSKEFKAYKSMALNQGDHIRTGKDSSVVLKVLDHDDEVTIGANASMYLSELADDSGGKTTKMTVWSGSSYVKSGKLSGNDELVIETPTAVMGVRGTHFVVSYNPYTGMTDISALSGIVQARYQMHTEGDGDSSGEIDIYPTMSGLFIDQNDDGEGTQQEYGISFIIDLDQLSARIEPSILEALLRNKQEIDTENEELLQNLQSLFGSGQDGVVPPQLDLENEQDFERLQHNLQNLIAALLQSAVRNGVLTDEQLEEIIRQAESDIDVNVDVYIELSERQRQEQQRARDRRDEQERRKQELLDSIQSRQEQQRRELEDARKEDQEEAMRRFLEELQEKSRRDVSDRRSTQPASPQTGTTDPGPSQPGATDPDSSQPETTDPTRPVAATASLVTQGDYASVYRVEVKNASGGHITGLSEGHFLFTSGTGSESIEIPHAVRPMQNGAYEVTLTFEASQVGNTVTPHMTVSNSGGTVSTNVPASVVMAPILQFVKSEDSKTFSVQVKHLVNIQGLQIHVLHDYTGNVAKEHPGVMQSAVIRSETISGFYDYLERNMFEELYAVVPGSHESYVAEDAGSDAVTLMELNLGDIIDSFDMLLEKVVIVTDQGEYVFEWSNEESTFTVIDETHYEIGGPTI